MIRKDWIPAFAGMTGERGFRTFYEIINLPVSLAVFYNLSADRLAREKNFCNLSK